MGWWNTTDKDTTLDQIDDFLNIIRKDRIKIRQRDDYLFESCELSSEQVHECVAAPGVGNRLIIKSASIATNGEAGEAIISGTINASTTIIAKLYLAKTDHSLSDGIIAALDENTNINMTSTGTASNKVLYRINYIIEDV